MSLGILVQVKQNPERFSTRGADLDRQTSYKPA